MDDKEKQRFINELYKMAMDDMDGHLMRCIKTVFVIMQRFDQAFIWRELDSKTTRKACWEYYLEHENVDCELVEKEGEGE